MTIVASKRYLVLAVAGAIALGFSASSGADEVKVYLSGKEEVPPVTTAASGQGTVSVSNKVVTGSIATEGVAGTMAHIHSGKKGENGPPVITLEKSGNRWVVPTGSRLTDEANKAFEAGQLYVNVHSEAHPQGEIRGQIEVPVWMKDQPKGRSSVGGY